jgi:DNA-binding transcriptional regulator YiaG
MTNTCSRCGREYEVRTASLEDPYDYSESGLSNIRLVGIPVYRCPSCSVESADIPNMDNLHRLIAKDIILTPFPMSGSELRFLRKEARLTTRDFAERLGVDPRTLTGWEASASLNRQSDILSRLLITGELWQGKERIDVIEQLAGMAEHIWEPEAAEPPIDALSSDISRLAGENTAYGLNADHEWRMAA